MKRLATWASEWVETLRVAPPFSRRRRDLIAASRDIEWHDAWIEVERPDVIDGGCAACGHPRWRDTALCEQCHYDAGIPGIDPMDADTNGLGADEWTGGAR